MENKFLCRGKRKDNGEWVKGNLIQSCDATDGWETIIIPVKNSNMFTKHIKHGYGNLGFENWYRVDASTICQCTGLRDKNGKLIWENDIVKDNVIYGAVKWDDANARYVIDDREDGYQDYSEWWQEVEVIGNALDNPELLEV